MTEFIDWLNNAVNTFDPLWRDLLAGFAIFLETSLFIGLLVPGDTIVLAAGALVRDCLDFLFLFLAVMAGSFAGESLGFYIGRLFGARIRSSKLGLKIPAKVWHQADAFVESRGGLAIAMSRFLPVLHSVVPVTAGMTKMTYRTFISWTVGACAVWSSVYLGIGWFAHGATDSLKQFKFGGAVFAGIILVFLVVVTIIKKRLEKSAAAMIEESEEAKARAKKLREAEMKRPNA